MNEKLHFYMRQLMGKETMEAEYNCQYNLGLIQSLIWGSHIDKAASCSGCYMTMYETCIICIHGFCCYWVIRLYHWPTSAICDVIKFKKALHLNPSEYVILARSGCLFNTMGRMVLLRLPFHGTYLLYRTNLFLNFTFVKKIVFLNIGYWVP